MEILPVLTVADVRGQCITDWEQEVTLSIPFGRGPPLQTVLAPGSVVPKTIFKYQLQHAVYEGSANGGVRWWCKSVEEPCGQLRQAKFDISVRFECPHARVGYKKQETKNSRKRNPVFSRVKCPAFVRFKGCRASDDPSVAVVVTARFKQICNEPLSRLRTEFETLNHSVSAEILGSKLFVFVFENSCLASDALADVHGHERECFHGKLRAEEQVRFTFSVFKCNLKHERHLRLL